MKGKRIVIVLPLVVAGSLISRPLTTGHAQPSASTQVHSHSRKIGSETDFFNISTCFCYGRKSRDRFKELGWFYFECVSQRDDVQ